MVDGSGGRGGGARVQNVRLVYDWFIIIANTNLPVSKAERLLGGGGVHTSAKYTIGSY